MENTTKHNKKEIIQLLIADMRSRRLLIGLEATGLATDDFNSNLAELIFSKINTPKEYETQMWNWYEDTVFTLLGIDMPYFRIHQEFLAHKFYEAILEKRNQLVNHLPESLGTHFYSILSWLKLNKYNN